MNPFYEDSKILASHTFETTLKVFEILRVDDHLEKMVYESNCTKYYSWEIHLNFCKQAPFDYFSLLVTLKRTDYSTFDLEGIVVIWFKNQEGKTCPVSYQVKCKLKGKEFESERVVIDPHFKCLLRERDHLTLPADLLIVRVKLFVIGCCTNLIGFGIGDINMDPFYEDSGIMASHKFERTFNVFEILYMDNHLETIVYRSNCAKYNSWEIRLKFSKQAPFNYFILLVDLKRTDNSTLVTDGLVVIWFKNQVGRTCLASYQVECKLKGQQIKSESFAIDPHFKCLLREGDNLTLPEDLLIVRVKLFVKGCCPIVI